MKSEGHPKYLQATVTCSGCNSNFTIGSTVPEIKVIVCSNCHPFYTGKQKVVDTEGRVDRFNKKFAGMMSASKSPDKLTETPA